MECEQMWAISGYLFGRRSFYIGTWLTQREAIEGHSSDMETSWAECRKQGDRAVKVRVCPIEED